MEENELWLLNAKIQLLAQLLALFLIPFLGHAVASTGQDAGLARPLWLCLSPFPWNGPAVTDQRWGSLAGAQDHRREPWLLRPAPGLDPVDLATYITAEGHGRTRGLELSGLRIPPTLHFAAEP